MLVDSWYNVERLEQRLWTYVEFISKRNQVAGTLMSSSSMMSHVKKSDLLQYGHFTLTIDIRCRRYYSLFIRWNGVCLCVAIKSCFNFLLRLITGHSTYNLSLGKCLRLWITSDIAHLMSPKREKWETELVRVKGSLCRGKRRNILGFSTLFINRQSFMCQCARVP